MPFDTGQPQPPPYDRSKRAPLANDEIRAARMDEVEEMLLSGTSVSKTVRHFSRQWGVNTRVPEGIIVLVRARWKERADERATPESKLERHEELVSMVRQVMSQALADGKHQVALVATQQLAYLEGLNQQTVNVVHSGKVTVSDERLPFELLRAFAEVLRIADVETRRVLCADLKLLTAENEPERDPALLTNVFEAEGLRVVK